MGKDDMKMFISCRRADRTYLVGCSKGRLVTAFGEQTVFCDLDDIPAGGDFKTVLEENIATNISNKNDLPGQRVLLDGKVSILPLILHLQKEKYVR